MTGKQPKRKKRPGVDEYGRTPLHYAAAEGRGDEVIRLLAAGANPNAQDDNGLSPLHFAARAVSPGATEALLAAGADTKLRDSFGNTALSTAVFASKGDGSVIELLRRAGPTHMRQIQVVLHLSVLHEPSETTMLLSSFRTCRREARANSAFEAMRVKTRALQSKRPMHERR